MATKTSTKKAGKGSTAVKTAAKAATAATTTIDEFQNITLDLIIVEKQIRTGANVDDEDSQGFVDSIAAQGVIEPIVVTPREDKFLLLAGERRYLACQKLGLATIPARILPNVQSGEEVLTIQLIENLQRQEIDPIDKANAVLAFFQNRHGEMDLDAVMNNLILYDRADQRVPDEVVATVATISKIAGIKTRTLQNILSLLRLPQKIGDAVKTGAVPVSQGYILAADLENPGLMSVFESILENPVTNKRLTELLKKAPGRHRHARGDPLPLPVRLYRGPDADEPPGGREGQLRPRRVGEPPPVFYFPHRGDRKGQGGRRDGEGTRAPAGQEEDSFLTDLVPGGAPAPETPR